MGLAIAGLVTGAIGGALLLSWVAPLWVRLAVIAAMLALVALPQHGRLVTVAAFLLTTGGVGLAMLAWLVDGADVGTMLAASISVAVGAGCAVIAVAQGLRSRASR